MELMSTISSRLTAKSSSEIPAPKTSDKSLSMSSFIEHRNNNHVTKLATNKSSNSNSKSSSPRSSVPKSSSKTYFKAIKRPAGVVDLSRSKRPSLKRRRMMGYPKSEVTMHHSPVAIEQPTRLLVLSPACVKSSVSDKENSKGPLDHDNCRMNIAADPSKSGAGSTSSCITTVVSSALESASVSASSSVKPEASRIGSSYTAEALPVLSLPLNSKSSSIDTPSTSSSMITSSNSQVIPVLETSTIKSSETKSSSAIDEVYTSAELSAAAQLSISTPSKIEPSIKQAVIMPSTITETTASVIPLIDLDTWVSSPDAVATYSSSSSSIPIIKFETDTDKKPQLKVEENLKIPKEEIQSCEEEERLQETELEDAIRVAEARKELHRVRRKIEKLRSGSL
ncbi:hypothetical protein EAF00_009524 [Botryotinia globosa]|nr:hypothetical protein EAF00_009524 [Botryotinia globosa]